MSGIAIACGSSESVTEPPVAVQEAGVDATLEAAAEAAAGTGTLGAACTDDSQCGAGGTKCLKASGNDIFGNSGPGGGYCSLDCSDYIDHKTEVDPCAAIGGHCSGFKGSGAVCYETCKRGSTGSKCHDRNDVACTGGRDRDNKTAAWDVCQPSCGAATDCGTGRACEPSQGRCVDAAICLQLCDTVADCKDTVHDVVCDPATIADHGHGNCRLVGLTKGDGGI